MARSNKPSPILTQITVIYMVSVIGLKPQSSKHRTRCQIKPICRREQ